ncbi:MAG: hydrogenase nickel incorporation protein HypB [Candidatus Aenigmarchaeota archaeon]|nr:hydrogenase nickel incorporation protein HypB [Candidatus Aenigmarchaeota archaeon]
MKSEAVLPEKSGNFEILIKKDVIREENILAENNRKIFRNKGITAINIMGSVGSGKTTLIKALCRKLKDRYRIKVIAGDITTDIDAKRIKEEGVDVEQINTGGMCHLDANLINKSINEIGTYGKDIIFIENVGNLICPANFDLGEEKRIVVISVTEGPYMVLKHPLMFKEACLVVINKTDLADVMEVNPDKFEDEVHSIQPKADVIKTSLKNLENIDEIIKAIGF